MNVAIHYSLQQLAEILQGEILQQPFNLVQPGFLSLDSRKILFPENTVFLALETAQRDGHDFIKSLYAKGVRNFITRSGRLKSAEFPKANFLEVKDTLAALQTLASHHRSAVFDSHDNFTVVGITGSNGKTVVKEWLSFLLADEISVVRSPGSYNSQIGVPISVLHRDNRNTVGIFEAGISSPGEMEKLEKIIMPNIGILTNIGQAHDAGFTSQSEKAVEKLKLFVNSKCIIYHADDEQVSKAVDSFIEENQRRDIIEKWNWGKADHNKIQVLNIVKSKSSTKVSVKFAGQPYELQIPFADDASVENAMHCFCAVLALQLDVTKFLEKFTRLFAIEMRLEIKEGINHCTIINDSYSNDLNSFGIALTFLSQQKQHERNTVVLSDIAESGQEAGKLYAGVATLLQQKNIQRLVGIGPAISQHRKEFSFLPQALFYPSSADFLRQLPSLHFQNENILVKGARSFELENIVQVLQKKVHQTLLEINLNAVVHNLNEYKKLLKPETRIMGMVKAFSYGSGSHEIAAVLAFHNIDYLAVAYADEGVELRQAGINQSIMVMNVENSSFGAMVQYNLQPELYSFFILDEFTEYLKKRGFTDYPVHLKIDTGMHRLGFTPDDIPQLCDRLLGNNFVKVQTAFTHLVASEDQACDQFTRQQLMLFTTAVNQIESILGYPVIKHAANTSAISRHPEAQLDMVRLGIGLYGVDSDEKMQKKLMPVSSLTTTISQLKTVKAGESVGYGRKEILQKDSQVATVRIGYADGYPGNLGNGVGKMALHGKLVNTIGNICMDMTMLDVSALENVHEGEKVEVFGKQIAIKQMADWAGTIPYEVMTGISQRVKRVYYEE